MTTTIMNLFCQNKTCAEGDNHKHGPSCTEMCSTCHGIDWSER